MPLWRLHFPSWPQLSPHPRALLHCDPSTCLQGPELGWFPCRGPGAAGGLPFWELHGQAVEGDVFCTWFLWDVCSGNSATTLRKPDVLERPQGARLPAPGLSPLEAGPSAPREPPRVVPLAPPMLPVCKLNKGFLLKLLTFGVFAA